MSLTPLAKENLRTLRIPVLLLLASIVTGLGLYAGSDYLKNQAAQKLADAENRLAQARSDREKAASQRKEIHHYLPRYQALVEQGLVGQMQRLDLVEMLNGIRGKHLLYPLEYTFAPPQPYLIPGVQPSPELALMVHPVTLKLSLLHEGDLLTLLDNLQTGVKGMGTVSHCTMTRKDEKDAPVFEENLAAECLFDWITLTPPSPPQP